LKKENILIVEDNKALSKLIAKKISKSAHFTVDVAHDMQEAQTLVNKNKNYFVALLDLNLPDAPDGEIVDYVISKKIPSIVLTANIDAKTREQILAKDIIDYVYKGSIDDVNYIFYLIERLLKNRKYKVMVVDDSIVTRNEVKKMLQAQMFQVYAAAHGEEALSYMETNKDIKLILTDFNMPVIDGFELTKTLRETYTKPELSIIAMTSNSEELISSKFLKVGANDFINKPFIKEELMCRVNNSIESLEYIETISDMANIDFLTGVNNRRFFFKHMQEYFYKAKESAIPFAIAMFDVDEFKNINDTYGNDVGDMVICKLANIIQENTKGSDIIARFGGEEFCVAVKNINKEEAVAFFVRLRSKIAQESVVFEGKEIKFTSSIGVAFSEDESLDEMLNQADMALYAAKKNGRNRVEIAQ
jgi:diguanylate cyclase (GGDEF)-like protein